MRAAGFGIETAGVSGHESVLFKVAKLALPATFAADLEPRSLPAAVTAERFWSVVR
jgi:hypothetical protein